MSAWLTAAFGALLQQLAAAFLGWMRERRGEETLRDLGAAEAALAASAREAERMRRADNAEQLARDVMAGADDATLDLMLRKDFGARREP